MNLTTEDLERAAGWLEARVDADPELAAELLDCRAEYFAHRPGEAVERLAERRFREWFLYERYSTSRGGTPIESIVHDEVAGDPDAPEEALAGLLGSLASVFEVTGIAAGEGAWVRDLAGGGEYALEEPEASLALQPGDLLVGRVFQVGGNLHRLSPAAGLFRDERLLAAVRRDLEQARASRRGTLRLSQADLERMFWGSPDHDVGARVGPTLDEALARARVVLAAGGLEEEACEAVFEALRASPQPVQPLLPGGGDALGDVLARLAIESDVDLAAARAALLEVCVGFARADAPPLSPEEPAETAREKDVREAMEAFDRGRAEGRDLEELFRDLERDLGLDEDESSEEDLAPDFPGVVQAMVEEYLWELEIREGEPHAQAQAGLRAFGTFGADIGVFENLTRRDLLVFASIWVPEFAELADGRAAAALLQALEDFCAWCTAQHDFDLKSEFDAELTDVHAALPRLIDARPWFTASEGPGQGTLWLVRAVEGQALTLVDSAGADRVVRVEPGLAAQLRADDWLRGASAENGAFEVYCAYPPQSARLRPQAET
jgi:hypothetical protein